MCGVHVHVCVRVHVHVYAGVHVCIVRLRLWLPFALALAHACMRAYVYLHSRLEALLRMAWHMQQSTLASRHALSIPIQVTKVCKLDCYGIHAGGSEGRAQSPPHLSLPSWLLPPFHCPMIPLVLMKLGRANVSRPRLRRPPLMRSTSM